jgi:RNase P subunit RPR2
MSSSGAVQDQKRAQCSKVEAEINFLLSEVLAAQLLGGKNKNTCENCTTREVDVRVDVDGRGEQWLCKQCADTLSPSTPAGAMNNSSPWSSGPPPLPSSGPPSSTNNPWGSPPPAAAAPPSAPAPTVAPNSAAAAAQQMIREREAAAALQFKPMLKRIDNVKRLTLLLEERPKQCQECNVAPVEAMVKLSNGLTVYTCSNCSVGKILQVRTALVLFRVG